MSVRERIDTGQDSDAAFAASTLPPLDEDIHSRNPFAREQRSIIEPNVEPAIQAAVEPTIEPAVQPTDHQVVEEPIQATAHLVAEAPIQSMTQQVTESTVPPVVDDFYGDGWSTPAPGLPQEDPLSDPKKVESFHNAWTDLRLAAAASSSANERRLKEAADDLKQREHAAVFRQLRAQGIARGTGWR